MFATKRLRAWSPIPRQNTFSRRYKKLASKITQGDVVVKDRTDRKYRRFMECQHVEQKGDTVEAKLRSFYFLDDFNADITWRLTDEVEVAKITVEQCTFKDALGVGRSCQIYISLSDANGNDCSLVAGYEPDIMSYFEKGTPVILKRAWTEQHESNDDYYYNWTFKPVNSLFTATVKELRIGKDGSVLAIIELFYSIIVVVPPNIQVGDKIIVNSEKDEFISKIEEQDNKPAAQQVDGQPPKK